MTTTTADQIKPGDTITAEWAGCAYTGKVRSIDPAVYSTQRYGTEYIMVTFVNGGFWPGQDQSISIPASQVVGRV